ncbi:hypothetical protein [Plasmodium yoelii yoelii]|uniref:Uncharacterized protein n=1 Tax=Plasmodium yoelii yoelii TaxID=73239 RepID=Q7PDF9_PLAYO|nr:hypothetical protein [Plasmodium yoelii yoelii]EAA18406.1 hypothetical protein [Plasmodium yoelii yoelii]EAA20792.1 hypothetical protein [Plasmodium yoelii yoelii]
MFYSSWRYDYTTIHRDNLWHLSRFPDVELLRGFSPHFNSYFHYQNIISCSNILGFFVFFQEKSVYRCLLINAIGFNVQDFLTLNNDFYFQQPFGSATSSLSTTMLRLRTDCFFYLTSRSGRFHP